MQLEAPITQRFRQHHANLCLVDNSHYCLQKKLGLSIKTKTGNYQSVQSKENKSQISYE
jgi:hypothetical protein